MGKLIGPPISESEKDWISKQKIFFHASAPLSKNHRVNISPKSAQQFRVVDDFTVCWLDLTGSGSETAAHVLQNGRLTVMFVALEGAPKILRLFGQGELIPKENLHLPKFKKIVDIFEATNELPGQENYDNGFRCIVVLHVNRVTQSCGYSIPLYNYVAERDTLAKFSKNKGIGGMVCYRAKKNSYSIDGLPSIGQIERKSSPDSVSLEEGYYFATYDDLTEDGKGKGKKRSILKRWATSWKMVYLPLLVDRQRDIYLLLVGSALGAIATTCILQARHK